MIWRLLRLSRSTAKAPLLRACHDLQLRKLSRISTSNPNIATILSAPPPGENEAITVVGSIRTVRKQGHITFLELEDGSAAESLKALIFKKPQAEGYVLNVAEVASGGLIASISTAL